jgi:tRNA(Ile2) C34 agmatinyltransferase TiaS
MPQCPKCHGTMTGGGPHGDWAVQYECHRCGYYQQDARQRPLVTLDEAATGSGMKRRFDSDDDDDQ